MVSVSSLLNKVGVLVRSNTKNSISSKAPRASMPESKAAIENIILVNQTKVSAKITPISFPDAIYYRAYSQIEPKTTIERLYRKFYGYAVSKKSIPLSEYKGPSQKSDGFSTLITNTDLGGGWLEGSLDVPLGTNSPHDCAILNLINTKTNRQILFHVHPRSQKSDIRYFINTKFKNYNSVNILSGDNKGTIETVKKIVDALDSVNSKAKKEFYHLNSFEPEVVGYGGKLSAIKNNSEGRANFVEVKQFFYNKTKMAINIKKDFVSQ